jgi:hypothetical protein
MMDGSSYRSIAAVNRFAERPKNNLNRATEWPHSALPRLLRDMSADIALPESGVPSWKELGLSYGRVSSSKTELR